MADHQDTRYVACETHGPRCRAYIICKHLYRESRLDRSLIVHHRPWRDDPEDGAGQLHCAIAGEEHTVDDLMLVCEDSLIEAGLLPWNVN